MRGSVRQRAGKWCYVVDVDRSLDGKRKQQWKSGFATKKEAEQALVEVLRSLDQGSFVARSSMTAGEYLNDWLDGLQLKPGSIYAYRKQLRRHVIPLIGHVRIQQLDPPMVRKLYARLQTDENAAGRALSGTSVQLIHQILHRALGDAAREGLVARNVASLVKPPRRTTAERETWTAEQVRRFLEVAQAQYDYAMWLLMATTGMRRGEICGLQWKDFDLERESLVIRRSLSVIHGETILGTPKTTRGRRALALDPATVEALRVQRARHAARRLAAGPDFEDGDFVFPAPRGGRLQPSALGQRFQRLRIEAGLPYIRLHDLRHTYATLALGAGVHAKVVSERLGHAGIAITLDLYAHVLPGMEKAAALKVSSLFVPPPSLASRDA